MNSLNGRIPVLICAAGGGSALRATDALLIEGQAPAARDNVVERFGGTGRHPMGCACCSPRGPVAEAFSRLFRRYAVAAGAEFERVVVLAATPESGRAVAAVMKQDGFVAARFVLTDC